MRGNAQAYGAGPGIQHSLTEADLYEPPLTVFGDSAVERYFTPAEIDAILKLTASLAA